MSKAQIQVKLFSESTKTIYPIKTKAPKMTEHRGRTWDCIGSIGINQEIDVLADTTWGFYGYFKTLDGQWYKFKLVP